MHEAKVCRGCWSHRDGRLSITLLFRFGKVRLGYIRLGYPG